MHIPFALYLVVQMVRKGISKTTKRVTNVHEVIGTLQRHYEVTYISHSAPQVEPTFEVHG